MPVFADEAKLKETANMRNIYEFMRKKRSIKMCGTAPASEIRVRFRTFILLLYASVHCIGGITGNRAVGLQPAAQSETGAAEELSRFGETAVTK